MRSGSRSVLVLVTVLHLSCGGAGVPRRLGGDDGSRVPTAADGSGPLVAQNLPPNLVLRTTPPADPSTSPFPTIFGAAPLTVRFNLCRSDDPDPEDSLNYQFSFGDSGRPAFNPDSTFAPDFDHFCRTEHVYEKPGTYTATVSVTDKHLEDQSQRVVAFARRTQGLLIVVVPPGLIQPGPHPGPSSSPPPPPRLVITIVSNNGGMSYSPNPAFARAGQRVVWVNSDGVVHTSTADAGAFDTGFLAPGATSGAITLPAGTFPYHCQVHPSMVATLVVGP